MLFLSLICFVSSKDFCAKDGENSVVRELLNPVEILILHILSTNCLLCLNDDITDKAIACTGGVSCLDRIGAMQHEGAYH